MTLIDTKEAAKIIGCSRDVLYRYVSKNQIKIAKTSKGKNYFSLEEVQDFIPPNPHKRGRDMPTQRAQGVDSIEMRAVIDKWKVANYDTGSADVQIGVYTDKIKQLEIDMKGVGKETGKFYRMRKDLVKNLCERHKLLRYLQQTDFHRYQKAMHLMGK